MKLEYDLVIIGGGPAGLAVALEARRNTVKDILLLERDKYLGGILPQCMQRDLLTSLTMIILIKLI